MSPTFLRTLALIPALAISAAAQSVITTAVGSDWVFPVSATPLTAPLGEMTGVAVDAAGNVYGADCNNNFIFKVDTSGAFSIVAGNGVKGISPDGPATGTRITCPRYLVFQPNGDLYFTDNAGDVRIRKVTPGGNIVTVAGGGPNKDEGAPALQVKMYPYGLTFDAAGNLYYSEAYLSQRVRRIGSDGVVRTIAGSIEGGFSGDGGPARNAALASPRGIAAGPDGSLYITDTGNNRVRQITPDGNIRTIAGTGPFGSSGSGGPATAATLGNPQNIFVESSGSLLVCESFSAIRRIGLNGIISTVVGNGYGFAGDGGPATSASILKPAAAVTDAAGNIFFADSLNARIRKVDAAGRLSTFAGNDRWRRGPEENNPKLAGLLNPNDVAISPSGLVTFTDNFDGGTIRQISSTGQLVRRAGSRPLGGDQNLAINREIRIPRQIAFDSAGNIYAAVESDNRIVKIGADGKFSVLAGTGQRGFSGDGGAAVRALLAGPRGVALNAAGEIFIADSLNHRIRKIDRDGNIQTVAGTGSAAFGGDGGAGSAASLNLPVNLLFDPAGNLLIADQNNLRIRRIAAGTGVISTIAGDGRLSGAGDGGPAVAASIQYPAGMALDPAGNLYIADNWNFRIRVVRPNGVMSTVAGNGKADFAGDGGSPLNASLWLASGVAVDSTGKIYIADSVNDRIRVVLPTAPLVTAAPAALTFNADATGAEIRLTSSIQSLAYTASAATANNAPWLTVSPAAGTLPVSLQASVNTAGLPAGSYTGAITVNVPFGNPATRVIAVTVNVQDVQPPKLNIGSRTVSFNFQAGASPASVGLSVANQGGGALNYTASIQTVSGGTWLSASPASGQVAAGANSTLTLTAAPGALGEGTYSSTLNISDGITSLSLPVSMSIGRQQGKLLISQTGLTFTAVDGGGAPAPQTFGVLNEGAGELPFEAKATALSGGNWLKLNNATGRVIRPLQDVSFVEAVPDTRNLTQGDYYAEIRVTSPGVSPQIVTALVKVLPRGSNPGPEVRPTGLVFIGTPGSTPPSEDVRVSNIVSRAVTYTSSSLTVDGGKWLSHLPVAATVSPDEPRRVVVQPDFTGIAPGVKRGALYLLFDDGASRTINILSIVPAAAPAPNKSGERQASSCASPSLRSEFLSLPEGGAITVGQPVSIEVKVADDCGNLLLGTEKNTNSAVYAKFSNGDPDLRLVPIGGGVWSGTWRPFNPSASSVTVSAVSVFVQGLTLQAGRSDRAVRLAPGNNAPIVRQGSLVHGASQRGDAPVAPGTLVTIYGSNLADVSKQTAVPLPVEVAGTQVLLGGQPLPILYSSASQINAQIPYDLAVNTAHQVVVRRGATLSVPESFTVASAQPGIFTANQQGTGQGIVMGPDQFTVADANKPAHRGQAIVIYCTGLGTVTPSTVLGQPASGSPLAATTNPVEVTAGGKLGQVFFSGLTPGFTGLYQVNAFLAADMPTGDAIPLTITTAGQTSNIVTIAVR